MVNKAMESNIWKFYLASFLGNLEFVAPIFVLFLLANQLTMTQIFFLQSFFTVIIFVMEVPTGILADFFGRKQTLALSYLTAVIGFVIYGLTSTLFFFFIAETFIALSFALYSGADSAFVYDTLKVLSREKEFKKIMGNAGALLMLALGIASLPGGYLAGYIGYNALFFFGAGFYFIGFLICLCLKEPVHGQKAEGRHFFKHLKEGAGYISKNEEIRKYVIYFSLVAGAGWIFFFFIPPYFEERGVSTTAIGIITFFYFLANAGGFYFSERINARINDSSLLLFILFLTAFGFILLWSSTIILSFIIILIMSFALAMKDVITDNIVHYHVPSSHRATVISLKNMGKNVIFAVLGPIFGWTAEIYDIQTTLFLIGIALFLFFIYNIFIFRKK